jgi:hypothetical protein
MKCSIVPPFLTSILDGDEWPASCPGPCTPEERAPGTHWIGGWAGPSASCFGERIISSVRACYNEEKNVILVFVLEKLLFLLQVTVCLQCMLVEVWHEGLASIIQALK